jgi:uncharacterized SAM-binding protein YcdF (DUF218 family)
MVLRTEWGRLIPMLREILPLLLTPLPIAIGLIVLAVWRRKRWPAVVAVVLLWIGSTPICARVLLRLAEGSGAQPPVTSIAAADAILVVSGGNYRLVPGASNRVEWVDTTRLLGGLDLLRSQRAPILMFTNGVSASGPRDILQGDQLRKTAIDLGAAPESIVVVGDASTTEEEARAVREYFVGRPALDPATGTPRAPRIILVTSASHMPRAQSLFEAVGAEIVPFPVDFRSASPVRARSFIPTAGGLEDTQVALHEIYGRTYYWLRALVFGSSI